MKDTKPVRGVQLHTLGAEGCKAGSQVSSDTGEVSAGVLNIPLVDRDGDILLLSDAIGPSCLVHEHLIVLLAVLIQSILPHGHEDGLLKVRLTLAAVADGEFGGGGAIQAVQQFRVGQEHGFLILPAGYLVIDVGKAVGLGELDPHSEDAIRPNTLNGDHVLHPAGDTIWLAVLPHDSLDTFNHGAYIPPFPIFPYRASANHSRGWPLQSATPWVPAPPNVATPR